MLRARGKCSAPAINENFVLFPLELMLTIFIYGYMCKIVTQEFLCPRICTFVFHGYTGELLTHYVYGVLLRFLVPFSSLLYIVKSLFGSLIHPCDLES